MQKKLLLGFVIISLFIMSCGKQEIQDSQPNVSIRETIKTQVKQLFQFYNNRDKDNVIQMVSYVDPVLIYGIDSVDIYTSYQQFKKKSDEFFMSRESIKYGEIKNDNVYFSKDIASIIFEVPVEITGKESSLKKIERHSITFKRYNNDWKIVQWLTSVPR